jgi:hypothetical protein
MANIGALSICSLLSSALVLPNALAAEYTLMPSPQTVHVGHFSAALKPVLTINSGDIVIIETVSGPDPEEVDASGSFRRVPCPNMSAVSAAKSLTAAPVGTS